MKNNLILHEEGQQTLIKSVDSKLKEFGKGEKWISVIVTMH